MSALELNTDCRNGTYHGGVLPSQDKVCMLVRLWTILSGEQTGALNRGTAVKCSIASALASTNEFMSFTWAMTGYDSDTSKWLSSKVKPDHLC